MAKAKLIFRTDKMDKEIQEWCTVNNVDFDATCKIIGTVLGYKYEKHPLYKKIKKLVNEGIIIERVSEKLHIGMSTANRIIREYDDITPNRSKIKSLNIDKVTKKDILKNLYDMGFKVKTDGYHIPNSVYKILTYEELLDVGISKEVIEHNYNSLGLNSKPVDILDVPFKRRTLNKDYVMTIINDIFSGETWDNLSKKHKTHRVNLTKIGDMFPKLNEIRKDIQHSIYLAGYAKIPKIEIPIRKIMMELNPICVPEKFDNIPSVEYIGGYTKQSVDRISELAKPSSKNSDRHELSFVEKTKIEIYSLFNEGISTEYICNRFNLTQEELMRIVKTYNESTEAEILEISEMDQEILKDYSKMYSIDMLVEKYSKDTTYIKRVFKNNKVCCRKDNIERLNRYDIVSDFKKGLSIKELGTLYNVQNNTIRKILDNFMAKLHNLSNDLVYNPKMELCNWSEFEIGILESDMTDYEVSKLLNLPQVLIKTKRKELEEVNDAN